MINSGYIINITADDDIAPCALGPVGNHADDSAMED